MQPTTISMQAQIKDLKATVSSLYKTLNWYQDRVGDLYNLADNQDETINELKASDYRARDSLRKSYKRNGDLAHIIGELRRANRDRAAKLTSFIERCWRDYE